MRTEDQLDGQEQDTVIYKGIKKKDRWKIGNLRQRLRNSLQMIDTILATEIFLKRKNERNKQKLTALKTSYKN